MAQKMMEWPAIISREKGDALCHQSVPDMRSMTDHRQLATGNRLLFNRTPNTVYRPPATAIT
ncbi:hypothetical protein KQI52_15020 [bacterium]|nr:hypothetical protein [bacterium]